MDAEHRRDRSDEQRAAADELRREGMTRAQIARSLGVSTWRVTELLAALPVTRPMLRVRAKDEHKARARELRAAGRTMPEIAEELGVSRSSVSLWTSDLPKPPRKPYDYARVAAARRAQWDAFLADRERERRGIKESAAAEVGPLTERELWLIGVTLYWAEGSKDKPYARREHLQFINSDPDVIRVHLRWLEAIGVDLSDCSFRLSIHGSADVDAATAFWRAVVGHLGRWRKPTLKRHTLRTRRKNIGATYHGCLIVEVRRSRVLYQRMDGAWRGIVDSGRPR